MTDGAVLAAAAAAKRRRMLLAEEEEMTGYTQDDLNSDWEFKIVRADTPAFRNSKVLEGLIEEEARAGWVMLEKLDDSRVRFKRPRDARARDAYLPAGVDPYRTRYGAPSGRYAVMLGALLALLLGAGVFVITLTTSFIQHASVWIGMTVGLLLLIVVLALAVKAR